MLRWKCTAAIFSPVEIFLSSWTSEDEVWVSQWLWNSVLEPVDPRRTRGGCAFTEAPSLWPRLEAQPLHGSADGCLARRANISCSCKQTPETEETLLLLKLRTVRLSGAKIQPGTEPTPGERSGQREPVQMLHARMFSTLLQFWWRCEFLLSSSELSDFRAGPGETLEALTHSCTAACRPSPSRPWRRSWRSWAARSRASRLCRCGSSTTANTQPSSSKCGTESWRKVRAAAGCMDTCGGAVLLLLGVLVGVVVTCKDGDRCQCGGGFTDCWSLEEFGVSVVWWIEALSPLYVES